VTYLSIKFVHVLVAVVAVGSSTTLLVLLGFFGDQPMHGAFALRVIRRLLYVIVVPGYLFMLVSGMWMGHVAGLLDARWTEAAMNLWGLGASFIALTLYSVHRQLRSWNAEGVASPAYRRTAWLGRVGAIGWAAIVVTILYFMVFKPA
jgi:hypothetical protein